MKKEILYMLSVLLVLTTACSKDRERISGSGSVITEDRQVNAFTKVSLQGPSFVYITKGNNFNVQVKAYGNLLPYFETRVVNGTLEVGYKDNVSVRNENSEVYITMPSLNGLYVNGSGDIETTGNFNDNASFETRVNGSGNIEIEDGAADNFSSKTSGSGDIYAFGFSAKKANIEISGSGNTRITANDELSVKISGSGNVYYKGSPDVTVNISGSGDVIKQ
jgi:hypothetical protein